MIMRVIDFLLLGNYFAQNEFDDIYISGDKKYRIRQAKNLPDPHPTASSSGRRKKSDPYIEKPKMLLALFVKSPKKRRRKSPNFFLSNHGARMIQRIFSPQ